MADLGLPRTGGIGEDGGREGYNDRVWVEVIEDDGRLIEFEHRRTSVCTYGQHTGGFLRYDRGGRGRRGKRTAGTRES